MKNLALVGLMGAGKSTVGIALAQKLGMVFVDIDAEIEKKTGLKITEIFAQKGEEAFRELESLTIQEFVTKNRLVLSTGGGAIENPKNLAALKENCTVIYLKAPAEVLFERVKEDTNRPLLQNSDPLLTLQKLLEKREANYRKADIIVDTALLAVDEIVNEILKNVKS